MVVAGGGYAGVYLTSSLLKAGVDCMMIDPKPYFYHNVGAVRAIVKPGNYCLISDHVSFMDKRYGAKTCA